MVERYTHTAGTEAHAGPPGCSTPSSVPMLALENGHYYQVRITPRPLARRFDLEAFDSMLPKDMALPDGPAPLPPDQPPDPLTIIVSGRADSWQPRQALYFLSLWAQRRWQHTRDWSATWRFH